MKEEKVSKMPFFKCNTKLTKGIDLLDNELFLSSLFKSSDNVALSDLQEKSNRALSADVST